jgi:hypothetical protein
LCYVFSVSPFYLAHTRTPPSSRRSPLSRAECLSFSLSRQARHSNKIAAVNYCCTKNSLPFHTLQPCIHKPDAAEDNVNSTPQPPTPHFPFAAEPIQHFPYFPLSGIDFPNVLHTFSLANISVSFA